MTYWLLQNKGSLQAALFLWSSETVYVQTHWKECGGRDTGPFASTWSILKAIGCCGGVSILWLPKRSRHSGSLADTLKASHDPLSKCTEVASFPHLLGWHVRRPHRPITRLLWKQTRQLGIVMNKYQFVRTANSQSPSNVLLAKSQRSKENRFIISPSNSTILNSKKHWADCWIFYKNLHRKERIYI